MKALFDPGGRTCIRTVSLSLVVLMLCLPPRAKAADDIYCIQNRSSTPNFQLFNRLADDSSVASLGFLFSPAGGIYAATFKDGTFYAVELENGTFVDYLATIPHEGVLKGQGTRVGATPIGFPDVEAIANVNGTLIGASVDFAGHVTRFISISSVGVGTLIGAGSTDVMIFGLAYDPATGTLYGAGKANATVSGNNLFTINPATGTTTLIGPMGPVIQSLSWSSTHGLIGAFDHLYSISTTTGTATQIGTGDYTDGEPGTFNGVYAMAAIPPAAPPAPFKIISVSRTAAGVVDLEWESETGYNFQVMFSQTMATGTWTPASSVLPGTAGTMTAMHTSATPDGFYQVTKTASP